MLYERMIRPALFRMGGGDPEVIHERLLRALSIVSASPTLTRTVGATCARLQPVPTAAAREVFGLRFPTPIGLAAGFDKNGVAVPAVAALGFGFVEIGTVTRHPQPGNPRPRLFRVPSDAALINRMGFNNRGAEEVAARLAGSPRSPVPLGISLGKSKVTPLDDALDDYRGSLNLLYPYGDYFAVNVSSPNTPGLRALQERDRLAALLDALVAQLAIRASAEGRAQPKPLLVKLAPDLGDAALAECVEVCLTSGTSGLIAVNTTITRDALSSAVPAALRDEPGGLSGRPLHARAVAVVRQLSTLSSGRLPIIGCGGIFTSDDARRMLDAGASLLQIYTGFIYEGPLLPRRLAASLASTSMLAPSPSLSPS